MPLFRKRGSAPKRGVGTLRYYFPPNASAQWQPDGLTIHTKKWFLGAGFLGAPPISLISDLGQAPRPDPSCAVPAGSSPFGVARRHLRIDRPATCTANLRTKILDFRGFDSSIILILRGGILRPIGNFPESLSQAILVGIMLVGRLGVPWLTLTTRLLHLYQRPGLATQMPL